MKNGNRIGKIRNHVKTWYVLPEGGYPDFNKPVQALIEFSTFHLDDFPYVDRLEFEPIPGTFSYRWRILDAGDDEEEILTQDRFVIAWRYE